jgi:repressor LexA
MVMSEKISEKQKQVLKAIEEYIDKNNFSPTVRELADMVGLRSTATMHGYLLRLKKYGYINSHATMPRTITILKKA